MRIPCIYEDLRRADDGLWEVVFLDGYYLGQVKMISDHTGSHLKSCLVEAIDGEYLALPRNMVSHGEKEENNNDPMVDELIGMLAGRAEHAPAMKKVFEDAIERGQGMIRTEYAPRKPQPTQTEINMMKRFSLH